MDKINDRQTRNAIFISAHDHLRNGDVSNAIEVYSEALKTFPNDEGIMSDLAMALALDNDSAKLTQAASLCERVLSGKQGDTVHHTTRAALCFIYLKIGEKERAIAVAQKLPHLRESREAVLAQFDKNLTAEETDSNLRFIAIGESDEQDVMMIECGKNMVAILSEHDLLGKIKALRGEVDAYSSKEGYRILPQIRLRDNNALSPNQVRVRNYADYLLDKEFENPADAVLDIIVTLRKVTQASTVENTKK